VFEQVCLRVGFFVYSRIIAEIGTEAFAAHQIASQMMNISFTFADGLAVATTSLVGQYLGMNRPDLSVLYGKVGQRIAFAVSFALMTFSFTSRFWFPTWFTDDAEVIRLAAGVILVLGFIQPFQTSGIVLAGSLRGAGDVRYVAFTMLISVAIMRPALAYLMVFPLGIGLLGAWLAMVIDQGLRFFILHIRFTRGKWLDIKI
jgi:Na+-driven multidrug efflux pump